MGIKVKDPSYTIIDALSFRIGGNTKGFTAIMEEGKIKALKGPDELHLTLGLAVEVDKNWYIVNSIKEDSKSRNQSYILSMADRTKSTTFLMPMIGGEIDRYSSGRHYLLTVIYI